MKKYLNGNERENYGKDGVVRDIQSSNSISHSLKLPQESPHRNRESKERESKKSASPASENIYAKQYKKRESYERRFARPLVKDVFEKSCLPPNLKSTTKVKANFVPRVPKPAELFIGRNMKVFERNLFPCPKVEMKTAIPKAKQLLAKAKKGQRIRVQNSSINKGMGEVRSRSGRVVKTKKMDYDDVTSPKFKRIREEPRSLSGKFVNRGRKRPLQEADANHPSSKIIRVSDVKIDKVGSSVDRGISVQTPGTQVVVVHIKRLLV